MESILTSCTSCGQPNRVSGDRVEHGEAPRCGACKSPLTILRPIVLDDRNFANVIRRSPVPVLVDFWAEWCGPCHMLAPTIEQLARELAGKVQIAKLNVDQNPNTAARFQIRGIPALLIFSDGRETDRIIGVQPKDSILQRLPLQH